VLLLCCSDVIVAGVVVDGSTTTDDKEDSVIFEIAIINNVQPRLITKSSAHSRSMRLDLTRKLRGRFLDWL
jgi:hypothetical protein